LASIDELKKNIKEYDSLNYFYSTEPKSSYEAKNDFDEKFSLIKLEIIKINEDFAYSDELISLILQSAGNEIDAQLIIRASDLLGSVLLQHKRIERFYNDLENDYRDIKGHRLQESGFSSNSQIEKKLLKLQEFRSKLTKGIFSFINKKEIDKADEEIKKLHELLLISESAMSPQVIRLKELILALKDEISQKFVELCRVSFEVTQNNLKRAESGICEDFTQPELAEEEIEGLSSQLFWSILNAHSRDYLTVLSKKAEKVFNIESTVMGRGNSPSGGKDEHTLDSELQKLDLKNLRIFSNQPAVRKKYGNNIFELINDLMARKIIDRLAGGGQVSLKDIFEYLPSKDVVPFIILNFINSKYLLNQILKNAEAKNKNRTNKQTSSADYCPGNIF